jgi:hypothetical protein
MSLAAFPMPPPLYHIVDANLISARLYGIDLDVEGSCASFERDVEGRMPDKGAAGEPWRAKLRQFEDTFLGVLLHAWPDPRDPVVTALLEQARIGLARLRAYSCPP